MAVPLAESDSLNPLPFEKKSRRVAPWSDLKTLLSQKNECSTFSWVSAVGILICGLVLIFASFVGDEQIWRYLCYSYKGLALQGISIIGIGVANIALIVWDYKLRINEIPSKVTRLLAFLKDCQEKCIWQPDNYPHLCSPYSPCITLQWTYRDHKLVNLPWALLVKSDVIVLRPGQPAPANCFPHESGTPLVCGEVYIPPQKHDRVRTPTARTPLPNKRFVLQETPILKNVHEVLESTSRCPTSCYDKQRHLVTVTCMLHLALPILVVSMIAINIVRFIYVGEWITWPIIFLLLPVSVSIPLLPLVFPIANFGLTLLGYAKLLSFLQHNNLFHNLSSKDLEDPPQKETMDWENEVHIKSKDAIDLILGRPTLISLQRTINPLHVLGAVTALCCVDKKGILSWPNPTAEKVFFLRSGIPKNSVPSESSFNQTVVVGDMGDGEMVELTINKDNGHLEPPTIYGEQELETIGEVLDLTHDHSCPFRLQFDDKQWQGHIGSLKPIGLSILLNTCNMATHEHYLQFCSHVTCEALYNEDLVPVTNRRCLCELSYQIGFSDEVTKNFSLLEQLSTFRHVQPEAVRRDIKFARSLALATKLKLPFPHMVSVITSQSSLPNSIQLFSQATGDITLDSCVDFWDGHTLKSLTPQDRKKVLDFYQRTSLTAYCTAFAYRPLSRMVEHSLSQVYMELPADSHQLYLRNRSPTTFSPHPVIPTSQSIDSLYTSECNEDPISDIDGCFEVQCNQVFLGMVTMQYQAQTEMVQLIEQLERACIRFVHFSKENELRSRVFSEKMGLESGWNCHISLLSCPDTTSNAELVEVGDDEVPHPEHDDRCSYETPLIQNSLKGGSLEGSKTISTSAPCAINVDKQKFEKSEEGDQDNDSLHECWQSLSCMSDSTEQSAPINFDLSNRAKLPRGIDQIRPHLENVDNVPLLVSLFTDCTPSTTQQMIGIMQDYGEVVCVMGSSANADNCGIFLKADASICVEPMYPQVCQKVQVYKPAGGGVPSPVLLSHTLNSLPSAISATRTEWSDSISLYHLIMHARHFMYCQWNCIQFWVCCSLTLSTLQVMAAFIILPPVFSTGEVLWLSCVVIPLLSISLVFSPIDSSVMERPVSKNQAFINSEVGVFVVWSYGSKFLGTLILVPIVYGLWMSQSCMELAQPVNTTCTTLLTPQIPSTSSSLYHSLPDAYHEVLHGSQSLALTTIVLHLVVVSTSFVHREYLSWRRSPFCNWVWLSVATFILFIQFLYLANVLIPVLRENTYSVPLTAVITAAISPVLIFAINELVKSQEIKANLRYQKRARLEFGTKLGMNSPF